MFDDYKVNLPESIVGDAEIRKKTISEEESKFLQLRAAIDGSGRYERPGTYTGLFIKGSLVMSDTPDEIMDHLPYIMNSQGDLLIAGLGIGLVVNACAKRDKVTSITVVEINPNVITLVSPSLHNKIEVVCADINTYTPNKAYDSMWLDIWDTLSSDNLPQMRTLKHRLKKHTKTKTVKAIGCWSEAYVKCHR